MTPPFFGFLSFAQYRRILLKPNSLKHHRSIGSEGMENAETQSNMADKFPIRKSEAEQIADLRRQGREIKAKDFRREYSYGIGTNDTEGKTCICSGTTFSWSEISSGIMWVGVHGKKSICVVTKAGYLDMKRVHNSLLSHTKETVLRRFRRAVISEIEDLADKSSKLRDMLNQSIEAPFGVVSVIPGTDKAYKESVYDERYETYGYKLEKFWMLRWRELHGGQTSSDELENDERTEFFKNVLKNEKIGRQKMPPQYTRPPLPAGHEYDKTKSIWFLLEKEKMKTGATNETIQASNDEYDEGKAVQFLQEKMINEKAFTVDETIQIAVSAFQHLFKKKFSADEIEVSVMDPDYFVLCVESHYKDIYVKHLETSDIEQHLAVINVPGSNDSGSPPQKEERRLQQPKL